MQFLLGAFLNDRRRWTSLHGRDSLQIWRCWCLTRKVKCFLRAAGDFWDASVGSSTAVVTTIRMPLGHQWRGGERGATFGDAPATLIYVSLRQGVGRGVLKVMVFPTQISIMPLGREEINLMGFAPEAIVGWYFFVLYFLFICDAQFHLLSW